MGWLEGRREEGGVINFDETIEVLQHQLLLFDGKQFRRKCKFVAAHLLICNGCLLPFLFKFIGVYVGIGIVIIRKALKMFNGFIFFFQKIWKIFT